MNLTAIPFNGESYRDKTLMANAQEAINLYPMRIPQPQATSIKLPYKNQPEPLAMYPTPGYKLAQNARAFAADGISVRGLYVINNILYGVVGNTLLSFTATINNGDLTQGAFAKLGFLNTSAGLVSIECNTVQLAISDGLYGYTYNLSTGAFAQIGTTGSFPPTGCTNFTYYDGYIVGGVNSSQQAVQSNVLDATIFGAQAFDKVTSFPDNLTAVFSDELQLYIFGPKITEVQFDAGSIPYAFQKIAGVLIQAGCLAWPTLKKVGNTIMWLASDVAGSPYFAAMEAYSAKPVSTPPINEVLARLTLAQLQAAYSWCYREGDNHFYCTTVGGVTWCYDAKMDMWHKRSVAGGADLPMCYVYWQGNHVVGGADGGLYLMSQNYSYYGAVGAGDTPLKRVRTCQHLAANGLTMFIQELQIDMQVGYGFIVDSNLIVQPGVNDTPMVTLEVSKDFGNTWVMIGTRSLGVVGNYMQRLIWRHIGRFRRAATFRLTITDPVSSYILGARAAIKPGLK